tara:strand:- start:463 stop:693 length:231 start_codon:yes stop_codon:yes gene_type:complete
MGLKQEERGGASPEESGKPPGNPGCSGCGLLLGGCIGAIVGGAEIGLAAGEMGLGIGFNLVLGGIGGGVLGAVLSD